MYNFYSSDAALLLVSCHGFVITYLIKHIYIHWKTDRCFNVSGRSMYTSFKWKTDIRLNIAWKWNPTIFFSEENESLKRVHHVLRKQQPRYPCLCYTDLSEQSEHVRRRWRRHIGVCDDLYTRPMIYPVFKLGQVQ